MTDAEAQATLVLFARAARLADETDVDLRVDVKDDGSAALTVNSSDLFAWGYSNFDEVTPELLTTWEQAAADVKAALPDGKSLSCSLQLALARIEQTRPQGAYYKYFPKETWPLFNACGPHRPAEVGNPIATPDDPA